MVTLFKQLLRKKMIRYQASKAKNVQIQAYFLLLMSGISIQPPSGVR